MSESEGRLNLGALVCGPTGPCTGGTHVCQVKEPGHTEHECADGTTWSTR
jgi:hypothetical protein